MKCQRKVEFPPYVESKAKSKYFISSLRQELIQTPSAHIVNSIGISLYFLFQYCCISIRQALIQILRSNSQL